ncbi:MAG TPA: bifunctional methylenetetrahydrofolate dehydrogenase/methenyltetrahydrofolate cyclohydrolase FolD [Chthonomonadales bacterium]|nr:bifunctional methylenetetrahydrofolate dehydrogenase/methenyltetrahydrofolate cyclohydrolase FolD [Chthonomonadales bacterium]
MSAVLLDGRAAARAVRKEVAAGVARLVRRHGFAPHLAAVLVGNDPASAAYVGMKERASGWVGIASRTHRLPPTATQSELESLIDCLNADTAVHGILVQHPLPHHIDETAVLARLSPAKDVDGVSGHSLGALVTGSDAFVSCTPLGIMELLDRYHLPIEGRRAVVVGRSIILGKPLALLLLNRHATVTVCHSRTRDLTEVTREADILVAAAGRPEMIRGADIKPGAIVVDAGYSRLPGRTGDVGDVEFATAQQVAGYITPVPGGVGPMTIAMLLRNTLGAAERQTPAGWCDRARSR